MDSQITQSMVEEVTAQVVRALGKSLPAGAEPIDTLALISSPLVLPDVILRDVKEEFGPDTRYILYGEHLQYSQLEPLQAGPQQEQAITEAAGLAEHILLLAPKTSTLVNLVRGDANTGLEELVLRCLLWRKRIHVWLDFLPVHFKRDTFFAKVADSVESLRGMGVEVSAFDWLAALGHKSPPTLVVEADVLAAASTGEFELICAAGALVTPSAKDRATECDIRIVRADRI